MPCRRCSRSSRTCAVRPGGSFTPARPTTPSSAASAAPRRPARRRPRSARRSRSALGRRRAARAHAVRLPPSAPSTHARARITPSPSPAPARRGARPARASPARPRSTAKPCVCARPHEPASSPRSSRPVSATARAAASRGPRGGAPAPRLVHRDREDRPPERHPSQRASSAPPGRRRRRGRPRPTRRTPPPAASRRRRPPGRGRRAVAVAAAAAPTSWPLPPPLTRRRRPGRRAGRPGPRRGRPRRPHQQVEAWRRVDDAEPRALADDEPVRRLRSASLAPARPTTASTRPRGRRAARWGRRAPRAPGPPFSLPAARRSRRGARATSRHCEGLAKMAWPGSQRKCRSPLLRLPSPRPRLRSSRRMPTTARCAPLGPTYRTSPRDSSVDLASSRTATRSPTWMAACFGPAAMMSGGSGTF